MSNRNRWILPGLAAGAVLAMLTVPATRQLLLTQLGRLAPLARNPLVSPETMLPGDRKRLDAFVAAHPQDVPVQVAAATAFAGTTEEQMSAATERARRLAAQLPGSAAAQAAALRILCRAPLVLDVDAARTRLGLPPEDPQRASDAGTDAPDAVELALDVARRGGQLAPDNAFFPYFEAGLLESEGRRDEARAALKRAGDCATYDDYIRDEADGRLRISRDAFGAASVLNDIATSLGILFPHLAVERNVAKLFKASAQALEKAGDRRTGADVRLACMRVGSLMRRDASSAIGNLVGIAITSVMAEGFPGDPPKPSGKAASDSWQRERMNRFANYLARLGRERDADWVVREAAAGRQTRDIVRQGADRVWSPSPLVAYLAPFAVGGVAARNAIIVLLLGALAWLASRATSVREGRPLPSPLLAIPVAVVLLAILWGPATIQGRALYRLTRTEQDLIGVQPGGLDATQHVLILAAADSVIPIVLLAALAAWCLKRRIPLSVGMTRAIEGLALPLASVLLLINAACSVPTLRADRQIREQLVRCTHEEGREFARVLGRRWPN